MSITQTLFERWKSAKGIDSNRAAMRALGLSPTANIHWKAGRNADADVIERMATDLGENAGELIAKAMAEQARGEAARTWERIAKQLGAAAVLVLAVALPWQSKAANNANLNNHQSIHYAKWRRRMKSRFASMARRFGALHASPMLA